MRAGLVVASIVLLVASLAWRLPLRRDVQPGTDQASVARWALEMAQSKHVLPRGSLQGDSGSLVFNAALPIYNDALRLFIFAPIAAYALISKIVGFDYHTWMGALLFIAALIAPLVGLLVRESLPSENVWAVPAGIVATLSCAYLHWFGFAGIHNFGILVTYLTVLLFEVYVARGRFKKTLYTALILSGFSYWTAAMMIVPFIAVRFAFDDRVRARLRWRGVILMLACASVSAVFMLVFLWISHSRFIGFRYAAASGGPQHGIVSWVLWAQKGYSTLGLLVGLSGAGWAFFDKQKPFRAPLVLVLIHLCWWVLLPGFTWNGSNSAVRTFPYLLPSLAFGVAYCALRLLAAKKLALRAAVLIPLAVVAQQMFWLRDARAFPDLYEAYFSPRENWRSAAIKLQDRGRLWAWDYPLQDSVVVLNPRLKDQLAFAGTLKTLGMRQENGTLREYLSIRGRAEMRAGDVVLTRLSDEKETRDTWRSLCRELGCAAPEMVSAPFDEAGLSLLIAQ
jgi:hypothetical protein